MRILNVCSTLAPVEGGGLAERTWQMSRGLALAGHQTTILTLDRGLTQQRRTDADRADNLKLVALPLILPRYPVPHGSHREIDQLVAEADIVHLMGHWSVLNVLVQRAARKYQRPYVVCPAGELPIAGRSHAIKRCFNWLAGRRVVRQASAHIAITRLETTQFAPYGISPDSVAIIPNGIDPADYHASDGAAFRSRFGLSEAPLAVYLGRLTPIKGPDLLLEAFLSVSAELPDCQLVYVGPDEGMEDQLKRRTAEAGAADRIHFVGWLGGDEKSRGCHAADLLIIPSRQEAMSIVVLEAGICGTPVLITDQCGFDQVQHIDGGLIVPATVAGLAGGLTQLLNAPDRLPEMGRRLRRHVQENFCWSSNVHRFIELYEPLVNASG